MKVVSTLYISLTSHTLHREEGSGHAATIKMSPRQKRNVINQIRGLHRLEYNYIITCLVDVSILLSNDNCVSWQQLDDCSMTRSFLSVKGVACETMLYT